MLVETDSPFGIDPDRHVDLSGREQSPWGRRAVLVVIAVIPVLGLLNVFGQRAQSTRAFSPDASLLVKSPERVRGGLTFTTKIVVTPHRDIQDAQLYLDEGWFGNMTLNGLSPQPSNEGTQGRYQTWDFGPIQANQPLTVLISWQANPTNVGSHPETVAFYDGNNHVVTVHRSVFVFP
jgi:hypothetical protein